MARADLSLGPNTPSRATLASTLPDPSGAQHEEIRVTGIFPQSGKCRTSLTDLGRQLPNLRHELAPDAPIVERPALHGLCRAPSVVVVLGGPPRKRRRCKGSNSISGFPKARPSESNLPHASDPRSLSPEESLREVLRHYTRGRVDFAKACVQCHGVVDGFRSPIGCQKRQMENTFTHSMKKSMRTSVWIQSNYRISHRNEIPRQRTRRCLVVLDPTQDPTAHVCIERSALLFVLFKELDDVHKPW